MKKALIATIVMSSLVSALSLSANAANDKQILHDEKGKIHNVTGTLGKVSGTTAEERGLNALEKVKADFGIEKAHGQFKVKASHQDEIGTTHSKFQQTLNGLKVFHHEMIVHEKGGEVLGVTGDYAKVAANATEPVLQGSAAIQKALAQTGFTGPLLQPATAELGYAAQGGEARLAYAVTLSYAEQNALANWQLLVDALDGSILSQVNAAEALLGAGIGTHGELRWFNTTYKNGTHILEDRTKPMSGTIQTHEVDREDPVTYYVSKDMTDPDNFWNGAAQRAGVDAHYYAGKVYDYYYNRLGRNSFDGNGHTIRSVVHFGTNHNNAYFFNNELVFGDGDGEMFSPLSGSLDVIAHELSHGVTNYTSGLLYEGQPGSLNESFSDVMAIVMDADDWQLGEDVWTPNIPGDACRDLANPELYGHPAHMDDYRPDDRIDVNSGIPNKAFYNFATGIGSRAIAGKVWYTASRDYMIPTSTFSGARSATLQAAAALYGAKSQYYKALVKAWNNVGVY